MATTPKIGILYTGGTIGMAPTAQGLAPSANLAALAAPYLLNCQVEWHIYTPLIDSSAVNLHHWQDWLTWVAEHLDAYDGLLILHGTDTMAYTANILALAQPNLTKPIVLTGAQWPLRQAHSDAPLNLQTALAALTLPGFRQVAIAFHGQLWRAVGSSKVSTESIDGFATPHFPSLGKWQPENKWSHLKLHTLPAPDDQMQKQPNTSSTIQENVRIHSFVFTPGANIDMITTALTQQPADGVVLQTYGHGNVPTHPGLMKAIQAATHQGTPILNISQVPQGCTAAVYAQGHALLGAGVINGGKCNLETATALLTLAASNHWSSENIEATLRFWQLLPPQPSPCNQPQSDLPH